MAWDVTVPDTYAESHIGNTATKPGAAAHKTAQNKIDKYSKLASTHIFWPFAICDRDSWYMAWDGHWAHTRDWQAYHHYHRRHPGDNVFSKAFPWLCKEEMHFLSTTPWSQSKLPLQPQFSMSSLVFLPEALCWWAKNIMIVVNRFV